MRVVVPSERVQSPRSRSRHWSEEEEREKNRLFEMAQKIRIRLKAYDHRLLDQAATRIVDTAQRTGTRVAGPVPLPTSITKYTVIRSPFKDKDSRDQYEMRVHKRILDILDPNPKVVDALMRLNLPSGVNIEIKL